MREFEDIWYITIIAASYYFKLLWIKFINESNRYTHNAITTCNG